MRMRIYKHEKVQFYIERSTLQKDRKYNFEFGKILESPGGQMFAIV